MCESAESLHDTWVVCNVNRIGYSAYDCGFSSSSGCLYHDDSCGRLCDVRIFRASSPNKSLDSSVGCALMIFDPANGGIHINSNRWVPKIICKTGLRRRSHLRYDARSGYINFKLNQLRSNLTVSIIRCALSQVECPYFLRRA